MPRPVLLKRAAPLLAIGVVQLAILVGAWLQDAEPLTPAQKRAERADVGGPFPLELRSPQVLAGTSARVLVALRRPSLAELDAKTHQSPPRQRAYVRSLHREARALMSALDAKGVRFGRPVLFARVWSGFAATIATKDLPAVQTLGLRVEPVARFYPAQVPAKDAPAVRPLPTTPTRVGRIAVLDAFPAPGRDGRIRLYGPRGVSTQPARTAASRRWLHGLAADEVGGQGNRRASVAEASGLRIGAVLSGELPKARIDNIRVAGSQPLENGKFQVFGTTDQLLAGLERVVDPDQDGDVADAPRVAVTGLSAPYSGFDRSAVAEAVDGAAQLGTLVVAAAGNGGHPDGPFGAIGAPGAAQRALTVGALDGSGDVAEGSSRGPTYGLAPKPDLAIGGGASTAAGQAWGTAIAAARVAGVAAALRADRRDLDPDQAAAALIGTAAPRGEPDRAGGGDPLLQAARATPFVAEPAQVVLEPGEVQGIRVTFMRGVRPIRTPKADGLRIRLTGGARHPVLFVSAQGGKAASSGRIDLGPIAIPYSVVTDKPPAPPLGTPRVIMRRGKPDGVRFTAGSLDRGDKGTSVVPVGNLILTLTGPSKRELTPPGGARDLLPGEYAYTLTDEIKSQLAKGRYRFELQARGTAGGTTVVRRSRSFQVS
ncbi:MAG TPA: S8 family serine peptidase [Thermoleophilaceae bacterium]